MQGNKKLVDAALKKKISKFVLMSSLLTNGKEAGQSLNPGMHPTQSPQQDALISLFSVLSLYLQCAECTRLSGSPDHAMDAGYIFLNLFGNVLNEKLEVGHDVPSWPCHFQCCQTVRPPVCLTLYPRRTAT